MNIFKYIQSLKIKQENFYTNNPKAFWIHSALTLAASGWTFVKTLKSINRELDEMGAFFLHPFFMPFNYYAF